MSSSNSKPQPKPSHHKAKGDQGKNNKRKQRRELTREEKISRALSWALRHRGPKIGLTMTPDGFVPVAEIMACREPKLHQHGITLRDLQEIVQSNDKQRYHMDWMPLENYPNLKTTAPEDTINHDKSTILCIRASQGHSLSFIDANLLLTPIPPEQLMQIPVIVHGTYRVPWETAIRTQGLNKMTRNHIHFASGLPQDGVISGMRRTSEIYIYIHAAKCATKDDILFYQSANGVILTAGIDGCLPVEYFSHVIDAKGNILLDQREQEDSALTTTTTITDGVTK
ncbi:tRNA 2'-phosphotransferase 1 [Seminavis robusta]|uniref:2'-phosphotransferase n=1 Tax=Seminavis robusta TaxID=568900 RepID=A0A9N8DQG7_9STRA|nr:tRNA 2'-phosphotransferase 1 [Seminavis robusta]|eukprot:Sro185_g080260.1 tRNA 2'-phosphotransferase 1 (283) ;mRNA; r:30837-31685